MADSIKVLVVGSAFGSITSLFEKVSAIDKKHGKFSVLLCTGDFFSGPVSLEGAPDEVSLLLDGKITVPMTTYITQGEYKLPPKVLAKVAETGGEICPNVIYLGKAGIMNVTSKIRVGCLGGILDIEKFIETTEDPASPYINQATIKAFNTHPLLSAPDDGSLASAKAVSSGVGTSSYVDILITHLWPPSITRLSSSVAPVLNASGTPLDPATWSAPPLDALTLGCKPRYHFASAGGSPNSFFWEREPWVWDGEDQRVARFVNLGTFGESGVPLEAGAKKPRWFYAFSIAPTDSATPQRASGPSTNMDPRPRHSPQVQMLMGVNTPSVLGQTTTVAPKNLCQPDTSAKIAQKKMQTHWSSDCPNKVEDRPPPGYKCNRCGSSEHYVRKCPSIPEGYVCKKCGGTDHFIRNCPNANTAKRPPDTYTCRACGSSEHYFKDCPQAAPRQGPLKEIGPDECWFCLSNPAVTKHLIVSIGSECYVTLPKGQLIPTDPSGKPPLVPGGGHLLIIPIAHYPTLLSAPPELAISIIAEVEQYKSALRNLFAKHGAAAVMFEVARLSGRGGHAHIQVVPVPLDKADKVEDIFYNNAQREGIKWEQDAEAALEGAKRGGGNYFRVDLPDGRKMISLIRGPFNLQFGRATLAEFLGLPERADWKACSENDAQQRTDAAKFKKAFASFDPALQ
ncbi:nucleolus protein [Rhizoctonia solani]|uniref:Nucleolus protein n=1 Tax=Rhizoctonia solani TaxID=456999 RepID=A0A8H8NQA9_9AGAM|nr:nucleolus protein [Rhizoctonia solani]QRW16418.1 nucleolus protein [Rhizoctonia solani]